MHDNYRENIRQAWAALVRHGHYSSQPYGPSEFAQARRLLDGRGWIPWNRIGSVLCLACGGGQQGPLFASLGYQVTVADISKEQLDLDRDSSARYGLDIECVETDMMDLSCLRGRQFDLVYQAGSACYAPNVRQLYREVASVLRPGGLYRVEHWNPLHLQLASTTPWDGQAYRIGLPHRAGKVCPWDVCDEATGEKTATCWHYLHPLDHLIGGLCREDFCILRFAESGEADVSAEPGSHAHLGAYIPAFLVFLARLKTAQGE